MGHKVPAAGQELLARELEVRALCSAVPQQLSLLFCKRKDSTAFLMITQLTFNYLITTLTIFFLIVSWSGRFLKFLCISLQVTRYIITPQMLG